MKQKTLNAIILLMLTITQLTGCDKEPPMPQAVTMNLGKIAKEAGVNEEVRKRIETITQQFSEEVRALSIEHRKEIEAEKNSLGDNRSDEDEQKIQTRQEQLKKLLIEFEKEGQARKAKEISKIRKSSLDNIMTVAQMVALERGASIILKYMGVFWSDSSVDITDEVIERMSDSKDPQPVNSEDTDI